MSERSERGSGGAIGARKGVSEGAKEWEEWLELGLLDGRIMWKLI